MEVLDLNTRKLQGALKGAGGSIRALALHPTKPLIASVGLDRFLRVHDTVTRRQCAKVYLKQQLTGVCWVPPGVPAAVDAAAAEDQQDDDAGLAAADEQTVGAAAKRSKTGSKRSGSKSKQTDKKHKKHKGH
eukprot:jgi/Chrzof1/6744/Cz19g07150.t1